MANSNNMADSNTMANSNTMAGSNNMADLNNMADSNNMANSNNTANSEGESPSQTRTRCVRTLVAISSPPTMLRALASPESLYTLFSHRWLADNNIPVTRIRPRRANTMWGTFTVYGRVQFEVKVAGETFLMKGFGVWDFRKLRVDACLGRFGCIQLNPQTNPGHLPGDSTSLSTAPMMIFDDANGGVAQNLNQVMNNRSALEILFPQSWRHYRPMRLPAQLTDPLMANPFFNPARNPEIQSQMKRAELARAKETGFYSIMRACLGGEDEVERNMRTLYCPACNVSFVSRDWLAKHEVPVERISPTSTHTPWGAVIFDCAAYLSILFGNNVVKIQLFGTCTPEMMVGDLVLGSDTTQGLSVVDYYVRSEHSEVNLVTLEMQNQRGSFDCIIADREPAEVYNSSLEAFVKLERSVILSFDYY